MKMNPNNLYHIPGGCHVRKASGVGYWQVDHWLAVSLTATTEGPAAMHYKFSCLAHTGFCQLNKFLRLFHYSIINDRKAVSEEYGQSAKSCWCWIVR